MVYKPDKDKSKPMTMEIRINPKTGEQTDSRGKRIPGIRPIPPAKDKKKIELRPLSRKKKKKE